MQIIKLNFILKVYFTIFTNGTYSVLQTILTGADVFNVDMSAMWLAVAYEIPLRPFERSTNHH